MLYDMLILGNMYLVVNHIENNALRSIQGYHTMWFNAQYSPFQFHNFQTIENSSIKLLCAHFPAFQMTKY